MAAGDAEAISLFDARNAERIGDDALFRNVDGGGNVAVGLSALVSNTSGFGNIAIGGLPNNTTGSFNVAVGNQAGSNVITGNSNICVGTEVFGNPGESNAIHIGDSSDSTFAATVCFIGGIFGQTATEGAAVFVNSAGQLGTTTSSKRFKEKITPMEKASEALLSLRPVTFHYKADTKGTPQFGLIAEEVEKVNPDLVIRDREGKPYTVRYEEVNAMLLNEFLKARRQIDAQQKQIDALTAGLQKVSARLEVSKSGSQTVLNDQ